MALSLGDVTFGLNADYRGLLDAQDALKKFGSDFAQIAKQAQQNAVNTGVAFQTLSQGAQQAAGGIGFFGTAIQKTHAIVSAYLGPLSHTANMITQLGRLMQTTGGTTTVAAGVFGALAITTLKMAEGAIRAATEYQKLMGILVAATGSAALADDQYQTLLKTSMSLGVEFQAAAEEFARFEAALRGTNVTAAEAERVFTGVMDQVAALRLPAEAGSRALLAFQQMATAGKVQMQEIRQLYNALPGSLELMAKGLNTTVVGLRAQVKAGLDAGKAIEAYATAAQDVYGAQAKENVDTITGAMNNLTTSWHQMNLAVDQSTYLSTAYVVVLHAMADVILWLTGIIKGLDNQFDELSAGIAKRTVELDKWVEAHKKAGSATKEEVENELKIATAGFDTYQQAADNAQTAIDNLIKKRDELTKTPPASKYGGMEQASALGELNKQIADQVALQHLATTGADRMQLAQADLNEIMKQSKSAFEDVGKSTAKMDEALANAKTAIADLHKEYAAMLQGPQAFKQAQADTAIDKQVESMQKSLERAKVPLKEMNTLLLQYKAALQGIELLKPAMSIEENIQKQKDMYDDVVLGAKKYGEYLTMLKGLPTQSLMAISSQLGLATTNTEDLAKAMSDLYEKASNAKQLESSYIAVNKKIDDLKYATDALTKSTKSALEYKADPSLFKQFDEYERFLIDTKGLSKEAADAQVAAMKGVVTAYDDASKAAADYKTNGEIVADALKTAFSALGSTIENFFKTGTLAAQDFINILEDMLTHIMEAIIEQAVLIPLEHAASAFAKSQFGAKGLVMAGGSVLPMAKGDILYGPTIFPMAGGAAVASEYGQAEAVVPLKRTTSGDLGVSMMGMGSSGYGSIVINNYAAPDAQAQVKQSKDGRGEMNLEIMITKAVSKDIKNGGNVFRSIGSMFDANNRVSQR